jgi:hypothetical protein
VLICRCAWHQRYCGYPRLSGVVSWRGWNVRFTDGICERCLVRFRAEHQQFLGERRAAAVTRAAEASGALAGRERAPLTR